MLDEHDEPPIDPHPSPDAEIQHVKLERVAHYQIEGIAARGGDSVVYRATDSTLQRTVALKVIDDATNAQRLISEARNTSKLSHPGIAAVYQAGVDDSSGCAFVAFEWVEGSTLRNHLRTRPAELADLLRYTEEIGAAVAYAHDQGWVHGDLKADNVVLTLGDGQVKLIDFGLSTSVEELGDGEIWGTPAYMAPELFDGAPRNIATDLFALGALLYEIATGALPFGGGDGDETKVRRAHAEDPKPAREWEPNVPAPLAQMIHSLIVIDPQQRGPTAAEVSRWARHARNPAGRRTRWLVPIVLLAVIAIGAYATRDQWWTGDDPGSARNGASGDGGSTGASAAKVERTAEFVVIGEWVGPEADPALSALLRDLLILSVHGDDPGSALIDAARAPDGAKLTTVSGRWERRDGKFVAEWQSDDATARSVESAVGVVELAHAIVADVWNLPRERTTLINAPGTTLCDGLAALEEFVGGVRDCERGSWTDALSRFEKARQEAGTFPEATAWEAAVRLALGQFDRAATTATLLRDHDSRLCRVLGDTLATPTRNRDSRWGRNHRLARRVDLTLDLQDPRSPDASLIERLEIDGVGDASHYTSGLLRLSLRYGRADRARTAFERLEAYGGSDEAWRLTFYRWRLGAPSTEKLPPARWMLRLRPPTDFLTIAYFLDDGDLESAVQRAGEDLGPLEAHVAAAMVFAVGGRFEPALELAGRLSRPLDRGWGERLRASILALAGDSEAAAVALHNARDHDPRHPKTLFLLDYIEGDPYGVEPLGESDVSDYTRWHSQFSALRAARDETDPEAAFTIVSEVRWVDSELQLTEWPELAYLAWLERIRLTALRGERDEAIQEFARFREWWPEDRPPKSRVSTEAKRVNAEIEGVQ